MDGLYDLYFKLKGLSIILFGEPGIGKTYLCAYLCGKAYETTNNKPIYLVLDENLRTSYGRSIKKIANAEWKEFDSINDLWVYIATQLFMDATSASLVVLDSITGVQEEILSILKGPDDPRLTMIMSRYATLITKQFAKIAHKCGIPTIIISHPSALFKDSPIWETKQKPAFLGRAIKNIDLVLEYVITSKGRRYLKPRIFRDIEKKPPFEYIDIDKVLGG